MNFNNRERFTFGDITEIIFSGGTPSTRVDKYWGGDINWLSSGETRNNFINTTEKTITKEGVKNSSTRLAKKGDIVMASAGQGFTRGQVSYLHIDTYINQSIIAIRPNPNILNNLYAYYNLKNRYEELRAMSDGHSIRGSITIPMIKELEIDLPPILEQKEVANILHSLDKKIEINNKINFNLEELAQTLYKHWFVDFEFPNEEGLPYKSSGGKMVESELGLIPEGWEVLILESALTFERGIEPGSKNYLDRKEPNTVKFIRVGDLNKAKNVFVDKTLVKDKLVKKDDVLVSFDGAIGRVGIGFLGSYSTGLRKIYDKTGLIHNAYIYFLMKSQNIQDTIAAHANGTTILHAGSSISHLNIAYSESAVKHFTQMIEPIFKKILSIKEENSTLAATRDELLPKLMSGEIEVPVEE